MGKNAVGGKKHPKPHKKVRNDDRANGKKWKKSAGFAPSNNNTCPRFLGYRLRGFQTDINFSGQLLRIFDHGHDVEATLIRYLKDIGVVKHTQMNLIRNNPPIDCFLDVLIELPGYGELPIEVKSIRTEGFAYRKMAHKPKDEHYRQLQVYLDIGGWDRGVLFYVNKNDNEYLPLIVERNQEFIDKLYTKWNAIYQAHMNGILSVRPYKKTSKKCRECSAFDYCWNQDATEGVKINFG